MINDTIANIKDAQAKYREAVANHYGISQARDRLVNVLINGADELVGAMDMVQSITEQMATVLEENDKLKAELDELKAKKAPKSKE